VAAGPRCTQAEETLVVVLARPRSAPDGFTVLDMRAPWQTRFARMPAVPSLAPRAAHITVRPAAARPIDGRRLVRAPWAEPLSAFAGVVVETQRVPDVWLSRGAPASPAGIARPAVAVPIRPDRAIVPVGPGSDAVAPVRRLVPVTVPARREVDGLIAIPVVAGVPVGMGAGDARAAAAPVPGRIIPFPIVRGSAASPAAVAIAPAPPATSATAPAWPTSTPEPRAEALAAPSRRGFLARTMALGLGLLASLAVLDDLLRIIRR
jgi:hypothetical protein